MKKYIFLFLLLALSSTISFAQSSTPKDTSWKTEGYIQANFAQVALKNWQGGGANTLAGSGFFHIAADYKKGKKVWENFLDAGYGIIRQGPKEALFQKSDDILRLLSKYSYELKKNWYGVALGDFQTFITPGYHYNKDSISGELSRGEKLSQFMAPGYLLTSLGAEFRPSDNFFFMVAPVSGKFTFVLEDSLAAAGAFGVDPGKSMRAEFGANVASVLTVPIMKNVDFENNINLFANYKTLDQIDVNWMMNLLLKPNDIFSAKVGTHLIYDQDVDVTREDGSKGPDTQFKQVLDVGIQYKF